MNEITTLGELTGSASLDDLRMKQQLDRANRVNNQSLKTPKEVEEASSGFEALLLHHMLKAMWSTVETSGMFGEDSNQSQIYRDMLNQAIADSVAEGRGIGVKEFIARQLSEQK